VATLGNDSLGVIDLSSGKLVHSITGLSRPQGVSFIPGLDKIYVSNAGDGTVDVFNGSSYQLIKAILLTSDADNMRYDATSKLVYVGYGDGGIALINATSDNEVGHFDLPGHPESFQLENPGPRIFVNIPSAGSYVAVIDRSTNSTVSQWAVAGGSENFPMALDEGHHRLYVGLRAPAELVVLDTDSGKVITTVSVPQDPDDIFYDSNNGCVYVSSGQGFIAVIKQVGQDHYESLGSIPTSSGSRTSLLVPELNRLYVAVPQSGGGGAEILVYQLPLST
jgi:DNA-binding beta-propeller fold protein YncE